MPGYHVGSPLGACPRGRAAAACPAGRPEAPALRRRTFLDVVPIPVLFSERPQVVISAGLSQAWRLLGGLTPPRLDAAALRAWSDPRWIKVAMEFRLEPTPAGTLLSTETRILATDPGTAVLRGLLVPHPAQQRRDSPRGIESRCAPRRVACTPRRTTQARTRCVPPRVSASSSPSESRRASPALTSTVPVTMSPSAGPLADLAGPLGLPGVPGPLQLRGRGGGQPPPGAEGPELQVRLGHAPPAFGAPARQHRSGGEVVDPPARASSSMSAAMRASSNNGTINGESGLRTAG